MKMTLIAYAATLVTFLAIDAVWLSLVAKPMYESAIGDLLRQPPGLLAAGAFYAVYCAGIVYFAVQPQGGGTSWSAVAQNGAFLGLLSYGTFAATNYAVLAHWTPRLAVADTLWGAVVTAAAALAGYAALRALQSGQ